MEKILFRGKRIENDEWVYGDLIQLSEIDDYWYILPTGISGEMYEKQPYPFRENDVMCEVALAKVKRTTVGRYIGLIDKNGNRIFKGDIIKVVTEDTHEERFIEVDIGEFTDDNSGDLYIGAYLKYDNFTVSAGQLKEYSSNGVEVIDNIYDNPELLKKQ